MSDKIIIEYEIPETSFNSGFDDLYDARHAVVETSMISNHFNSEVTILIQGYNRIEKTKQCVESVLKYTKDVDFDLLLIDNGSTDETFEYFKSIPYDKVRIIHLNKNISAAFPWNFIHIEYIAKYFAVIANDIIVTPNWLTNMITAAKSDNRIGMVNPISSNVSNLQNYDFQFSSIKDMEEKAEKINVSSPEKWHERLRLITLGTLYTKECLYTIGFPLGDVGFLHDFGDDDITFKIRRAGYKAILAKDTWIHHNHDFRNLENKDPAEFQRSLETGRNNFRDKYFGIDAWDDVNNYIPEIIPQIQAPADTSNCCILGVDVKCGTPILEIKNHIRSFGVFDPVCCAVTSEGKYFIDLQTVCGPDNVFACSPEKAFGYFPKESFDHIIIGNCINEYSEPYVVIKSIFSLLKKGGQMFFYLKNTYDIFSFLNVIGYRNVTPRSYAYNMTIETFVSDLNNMNMFPKMIGAVQNTEITNEYVKEVNNRLQAFVKEGWEETKTRLTAEKFAFCLTK
ncbi:MAG: glycosyltransferase [Oscillospiraceae bacterium]